MTILAVQGGGYLEKVRPVKAATTPEPNTHEEVRG